MSAGSDSPPDSPLKSTEFSDHILRSLTHITTDLRESLVTALSGASLEFNNWTGWKSDIDNRCAASRSELDALEMVIRQMRSSVGRSESWLIAELLELPAARLRSKVEAHERASQQTSFATPYMDQFGQVLGTLIKGVSSLTLLEEVLAAGMQTQRQMANATSQSIRQSSASSCRSLTASKTRLRICLCRPAASCRPLPGPCPYFTTPRDVFVTGEDQPSSTQVLNPWQTVVRFILTGPMTELMRKSLTSDFLSSTLATLTMLEHFEIDLGHPNQLEPMDSTRKQDKSTPDSISLPHLRTIVTHFDYLATRLQFIANLEVLGIEEVTLLTCPRSVDPQSQGWEILTDFLMFNDHLPFLRVRKLYPGSGKGHVVSELSNLLRNPVCLNDNPPNA